FDQWWPVVGLADDVVNIPLGTGTVDCRGVDRGLLAVDGDYQVIGIVVVGSRVLGGCGCRFRCISAVRIVGVVTVRRVRRCRSGGLRRTLLWVVRRFTAATGDGQQ